MVLLEMTVGMRTIRSSSRRRLLPVCLQAGIGPLSAIGFPSEEFPPPPPEKPDEGGPPGKAVHFLGHHDGPVHGRKGGNPVSAPVQEVRRKAFLLEQPLQGVHGAFRRCWGFLQAPRCEGEPPGRLDAESPDIEKDPVPGGPLLGSGRCGTSFGTAGRKGHGSLREKADAARERKTKEGRRERTPLPENVVFECTGNTSWRICLVFMIPVPSYGHSFRRARDGVVTRHCPRRGGPGPTGRRRHGSPVPTLSCGVRRDGGGLSGSPSSPVG